MDARVNTESVGNRELAGKPDNGTRRTFEDRRKRHLRAFFYQFVKPRRRNEDRRRQGGEPSPVDYHDRKYFVLALAILGLSIADVYATIVLLGRGSAEINPFMRTLLEIDTGLFFAFKYALTALGIFILLTFRRFNLLGKFTTLGVLYAVLVFYLVLVFYELTLISATSV